MGWDIDLSRKEYHLALQETLRIAELIGERVKSSGEEALCRILAWTWDSTLTDAKCEDFQLLAEPHKDLALRMLVGRLSFGRPISHEMRDRIERHYNLMTLGPKSLG